jgi:4-hydroxy-tetrahydrodipicolinate reductase
VGTHEIILATGSQTITLKHEAENRSLFAEGALTAAAFVCTRPAGYYTMDDLVSAV